MHKAGQPEVISDFFDADVLSGEDSNRLIGGARDFFVPVGALTYRCYTVGLRISKLCLQAGTVASSFGICDSKRSRSAGLGSLTGPPYCTVKAVVGLWRPPRISSGRIAGISCAQLCFVLTMQ